jgi:integrase/recombinase XerD
MGEADVRDPVGRVLAVLRDAGRAEPTVQSYRVVLERFAASLVERGLETASDRVGVEFVEEQTGVRLESLREPVTDRRVRAGAPGGRVDGRRAGRSPG